MPEKSFNPSRKARSSFPLDISVPVLLLIFYEEWLQERRKEWAPLSEAAVHAGFQPIVSSWETLTVADGMVGAGEAFTYRKETEEFVKTSGIVFQPDVIMTTWGTSGYYELFRQIVATGAYHSEYSLIAGLDGKCELEHCLRNFEKTTGQSVSRPATWLWDELSQKEHRPKPGAGDFVILKPSHSGQCKGIEIVPRTSLRDLARDAAEGRRPPFVIQELVENVFLYQNRRWDIRVNVLATSLSPLRYQRSTQGVAKTTGAPVSPGSIELEQWLNAESFLAGRHPAENLAMTDMLDYLAGEYRLPFENFWPQVNEIVRQTFSAIALQAEKENLPLDRAFMYPGFDFMLERDGKTGYQVRLLEINSHPGLGWEPAITAALMPQFRSWFAELMSMVHRQPGQ